jgi:hypothetical protein
MTTSFKNLQSSAVNSIEVVDNIVKVVYNSNLDKEYSFICQDTEAFVDNLTLQCIGIELNEDGVSVGKFLHQQIQSGVLVESK